MTDIESLIALGEGITPGPWSAERVDYDLHGMDSSFEVNAGFRTVVQTHMREIKSEGETLAEDAANCRAIARIHDLFAAIRTLQTEKVELRECLQQFVNGVETHMIDSPADDILANVTHRARQALSNTGEME